MKIAVINFSGNVGKTTIARNLLLPRITGAELVSIETINADEAESEALRGKDFAMLQQYLQTSGNVVVDIGASNIEDLLKLMSKYKGSHEDFDYYIIPTVPDKKQQKDTGATAMELARLGVQPSRIKILMNMVEDDANVEQVFSPLIAFLAVNRVAKFDPKCLLTANEIYQLIKHDGRSISELALDTTDYKALIAAAKETNEKVTFADKLAVKRLAVGVVPELDACFEALELV